MARAEVDVGSSLEPHVTLLVPLRCPTGSVVTPNGLQKPSLKADLAIYSYIVTVSRQYLSLATVLSNKWISVIVTIRLVFTNPVTHI